MKTIKELLLEAKGDKEISRETISNVDWTENMSKVFDLGYLKMDEVADIVRGPLIDACEEFYKENPTKRVATYTRNISIGFDFNDIDKSIEVKKLYEAVKDMGAGHWWFCCSSVDGEMWSHTSIASLEATIKLNSKKSLNDKDAIQLKLKPYKETKRSLKEYGNGYNNLPGEAVEQVREEVLKCATGATLVLVEKKSGALNLTIYPEFNISKVKKLTKDILSDEKARYYVDRHRSVSAGIARYYAEKRASGDNYTGD